MGALRIWIMAARPRTLPAAVAPVLVGSAAAWVALDGGDGFEWLRFAAAIVASVFIQIGTNLANDYSDAKRGADTVDRLGPVRVTASGLATPRRVLHATWAAFAIAVLVGLYLVVEVGPEILAVGVLSIIAGILYTGGPKPYGYEGLGEVFVFVFFGLVAVNGSYYVQLEVLAWLPLLLSLPVGLLSAAILVVNNVRDIDTDRRAGKRTLAVRLGRERSRELYTAMLVTSFALLPIALLLGGGPALGLLGLLSAPLAVGPLRAVRERSDGAALNGALAGTGALLGGFALLTSIGLVI